MSAADAIPFAPDLRRAVSRARWAVIQTGLITTGLALFGVFVLASRISEQQVMNLYMAGWIPAGVILVGIIAGSGYLMGAWWFGVGVGPRLLAVILLLQLSAYCAAQYAEFQTLNLFHRRTGEAVGFLEYFRYTTETWTPDTTAQQLPRPLGRWGYALRAGEAILFALGGMGAALALVGKPRCGICGGQLRRRRIGAIPADADTAKLLARLGDLARQGNIRAFKVVLESARPSGDIGANAGGAIALYLMGCAVCGNGYIVPGLATEQSEAMKIPVDARFAAELPTRA